MALNYDPAAAAADSQLTQEQIASRSQAATLPLASTNATSNTITPQSLTPATVIPYQQPAPTALPDVANLYNTPDLQPTPEETQAQGINDRLQTLNDQLVGKSADQTTANSQFGVDKAQGTITDLTAQLTGLKNDAAAIPLLLQKASSSQGIAQPLIDRQQEQLTRDNAVKALGVSSLLAASQGQLANAQSLADKAVAAKYDPIQAEIDSATKNLQLILSSPQYTLDQQNRAQKQLDIQKQKQAQLDQQKTDTSSVLKIATDAASNGADAVTLQKIQAAPTPQQALQVAAQANVITNGVTQGTSYAVPTPAELGNSQFYKYPDSPQVYTAQGAKVDLPTFKQMTGQTSVPDSQVNFSGIKSVPPNTAATKATNTQIITANGRQLLVDKTTGQTIQDLGAAYKSGSGTGTTTTQPTVQDDVASMSSQLKTVTGRDGYISPEDWKKALGAWQKAGRSAASFKTNFGNFINPADKQDYN